MTPTLTPPASDLLTYAIETGTLMLNEKQAILFAPNQVYVRDAEHWAEIVKDGKEIRAELEKLGYSVNLA